MSKQEEFDTLVRPLIKYINDNHTAHTSIIITTSTAELLYGEIGFGTDEYIKD